MDASGRQSMATVPERAATATRLLPTKNELLLQRKMTGKEVSVRGPPRPSPDRRLAAAVDASVARHGNRELAEAFAFLRTEEAQRILASYGFRPLT